MALSDYIYSDGTISVTAGQKAFTGAGTAWLLRDAVGAIVIVGGVLNVVGSITAENAGQFMDNWPGATQANVPYKMWLVTAEAATNLANHYRLAQIIASIEGAQGSSDILTALAGLTPVADQLAFFTAADQMDLVSFKAWARSMLGLTMAANKLAYGTGANTMGLTDLTLAGRTMIGAADADAQLSALGFSAFLKSLINDQDAATFYGTLGAIPAAQIPATLTPDKAFRRGNIVGTVSQAAGIPTGAIVERGSSGAGEWTRFADGTQICTLTVNWGFSITNALGGLFYSTTLFSWLYPAAFLAGSNVNLAGGVYLGGQIVWLANQVISTTSASVFGVSGASTSGTYQIKFIAIGRWY